MGHFTQFSSEMLLGRNDNHIFLHGKNNMSVTWLCADYNNMFISNLSFIGFCQWTIAYIVEMLLIDTKNKNFTSSEKETSQMVSCFQTCTYDHLGVMWPNFMEKPVSTALAAGRVSVLSPAQFSLLFPYCLADLITITLNLIIINKICMTLGL